MSTDRSEQIREFFESEAEDVAPATDRPSFTGNQNVVGNGNKVVYGRSSRPAPGHPNATMCPQCHEPTWIASDYCACGFNLAADRQARAMERERLRQNHRKALSGFVVALFLIAVTTFELFTNVKGLEFLQPVFEVSLAACGLLAIVSFVQLLRAGERLAASTSD